MSKLRIAAIAVLLSGSSALAQAVPEAALAEMERSLREHYRERGLEIRDLKMFSKSGNEASGFGKIYRNGRQLGAVRCEGMFNRHSSETLARCWD